MNIQREIKQSVWLSMRFSSIIVQLESDTVQEDKKSLSSSFIFLSHAEKGQELFFIRGAPACFVTPVVWAVRVTFIHATSCCTQCYEDVQILHFCLRLGFKKYNKIWDQGGKAPSGRDLMRIWMWSICSSVCLNPSGQNADRLQEVLLPVTSPMQSFVRVSVFVCAGTGLRLKGSDVFLTSNLFSPMLFQAVSYKNKERRRIYYIQL